MKSYLYLDPNWRQKDETKPGESCCKSKGVPEKCLGLCNPSKPSASKSLFKPFKGPNDCTKHEAAITGCFQEAQSSKNINLNLSFKSKFSVKY